MAALGTRDDDGAETAEVARAVQRAEAALRSANAEKREAERAAYSLEAELDELRRAKATAALTLQQRARVDDEPAVSPDIVKRRVRGGLLPIEA